MNPQWRQRQPSSFGQSQLPNNSYSTVPQGRPRNSPFQNLGQQQVSQSSYAPPASQSGWTPPTEITHQPRTPGNNLSTNRTNSTNTVTPSASYLDRQRPYDPREQIQNPQTQRSSTQPRGLARYLEDREKKVADVNDRLGRLRESLNDIKRSLQSGEYDDYEEYGSRWEDERPSRRGRSLLHADDYDSRRNHRLLPRDDYDGREMRGRDRFDSYQRRRF